MKITISLKKTIKVLSVAAIALIVLHVGFQAMIHFGDFSSWNGLGQRFNMGRETTVPTWYSQALFLIAAIIIFVIGALKRQQKAEFSTHWLVLGVIFVYLSIDDGASLHELLSRPMHILLSLESSVFYAWVILLPCWCRYLWHYTGDSGCICPPRHGNCFCWQQPYW